ncbi:MAG: sulfur carrier protein ThiS, partial [Veillonella parvula]|nr:sulfur carrier protein ThiS [Veillonella parvula]
MDLIVNGEPKQVSNEQLHLVLNELGYAGKHFIVELNGEILSKETYTTTKLTEVVDMLDSFTVGNTTFSSRLLVGTGKYASYNLMYDALVASQSDIVTVALRRVGTTQSEEDIVNYIPDRMHLLPNTSGARNADEAIRIARMAKALGCGDLIKIEVIQDQMYLMPDNLETIKATEVLAKEGFIVFPYMSPNLMDAKRLVDAGASCVMPLASPIGSNRGLEAKGLIEILINSIDVP